MGLPLYSFGGVSLSGFVPPPVSPQMNALLALLGKPRNRSEWEDRFATWQKPASDTEEERITATANRVSRAMRHSHDLPQRSWMIVRQGSHHNKTNTRAESDIDLCMCLTDAFFVDGPQNDWPTNTELGRVPIPFTFEQYRNHIAWCLQQEFGTAAVTIGKKAIHLHKNDADKIDADVVPAYVLQRYGPRVAPFWQRGVPEHGVAFLTSENRLTTNFPEQHYANGVAKNNRTGRRYKNVVRILKRMRNHIADNAEAPTAARNRARDTASFLIESLVYNCPDNLFGHSVIYDDVTAVLRYLSAGLNDRQSGNALISFLRLTWMEVNGLKGLFAPGQAWSDTDAAEFVNVALAYMAV